MRGSHEHRVCRVATAHPTVLCGDLTKGRPAAAARGFRTFEGLVKPCSLG